MILPLLAIEVIAVGSGLAWVTGHYVASEAAHITCKGLLAGPGPALVVPMRRGRVPSLIVASVSWALGLALFAAAFGTPDSVGSDAIWFGLAAFSLLLTAALLSVRIRRAVLGFMVTPNALQSRGLVRDDYVPWNAISEVGLIVGSGRSLGLRLLVDPASVHRSAFGRTFRREPGSAAKWIVLPLGNLIVRPELLLGLAAVGHADEAARARFGTADSLRLLETLKVDSPFPVGPPLGRWLMGRVARILVAFPPTLLVVGLGFYIVNSMSSGGLPTTLSGWVVVPITSVFVAPFVLAPNPRFGQMTREFGARRTLIWFGLAIVWWIIGGGATILVFEALGVDKG